jgi:hypothetical protein
VRGTGYNTSVFACQAELEVGAAVEAGLKMPRWVPAGARLEVEEVVLAAAGGKPAPSALRAQFFRVNQHHRPGGASSLSRARYQVWRSHWPCDDVRGSSNAAALPSPGRRGRLARGQLEGDGWVSFGLGRVVASEKEAPSMLIAILV